MAQKPVRVVVGAGQAIIRKGLSALLLAARDFQLVGEAGNGEETLQLCERLQPDMLLVSLPATDPQVDDLPEWIGQRWPQMRLVYVGDRPMGEADSRQPDGLFWLSPDVSEADFAACLKSCLPEHLQESRPWTAAPEGLAPQLAAYFDLEQSRLRQARGDRLAQELNMAGEIQAGILPDHAPQLPGWDIAMRLEPARETSGDFYDFIALPNGNWGILVGDVSDKGMGAALFMALGSALLRTFTPRFPSLPAVTFETVNERLLSDTRGGMFITTFLAILEPHSARLRFVNAGHPAGIVSNPQRGRSVERLRPTGMALGVLAEASWHQKIVRINPGDFIVLHTDGIADAQNQRGQFFGEERLVEIVRSGAWKKAAELRDAILAEVHAFVGEAVRQDDIALVVIHRAW